MTALRDCIADALAWMGPDETQATEDVMGVLGRRATGSEACVKAPLAASGLPDDQRRHPQGQQDAEDTTEERK